MLCFFLDETKSFFAVSRFNIVILLVYFEFEASDHTKHFAFYNITKLSLAAFSVSISYLFEAIL